MQFGLFSESGHRHTRIEAETFAQDIEEFVQADQLGVREAWIAEPNSVRPNTVTHAAMMMCKAAAMTKQIHFGHAIRQLPLHHPVDLVQEANMCDQVLEGRFMFGYGGTHLANREQLEIRGRDVELQDDRALVRESIDFILKCWTEKEPFDFEGQFWSGKGVHILPAPYQQPHPPIACACTGSAETIELAARHRFVPLFGRGNDTPDAIAKMCEMYIESAAANGYTASRRDFHTAHVVYVGETDAQAREEAREGLGRLIWERKTMEAIHVQKLIPPGGSMDDLTYDFMVDHGYYWVGGPDTVHQRVQQFFDESGGFGTLLVFAGLPIASPERVLRSWPLLMTEVAPRLAQLDPDAKIPAAVG